MKLDKLIVIELIHTYKSYKLSLPPKEPSGGMAPLDEHDTFDYENPIVLNVLELLKKLTDYERDELTALALLGRGGEAEDFPRLIRNVTLLGHGAERATHFLLSMSDLDQHLENGLQKLARLQSQTTTTL